MRTAIGLPVSPFEFNVSNGDFCGVYPADLGAVSAATARKIGPIAMMYRTVLSVAAAAAFAACSNGTPASPTDEAAESGATLNIPASLAGDPIAAELNTAYQGLVSDYSDPDSVSVDLQSLADALPDTLAISWADTSYDEANGATSWQDLTITFAFADQSISVVAGTVSAWNLDTDFLAARLRGERLDESGPLASRISAETIRVEGVAASLDWLFSTWFADFVDEPEFAELNFSVDHFDISQDMLVLDGLSLRRWELVPLSADMLPDDIAEDEEALTILLPIAEAYQWWIAFGRAMALDASLSTGVRGDFAYDMLVPDSPGSSISAETYTGRYLIYNMQGYDIEAYYSDDLTYIQDMSFEAPSDEVDAPAEGAEALLQDFNFERTDSYGVGVVIGMELDTVLGHLARAEVPSIEERDLMSLGHWVFEDINSIWFGEDLISVKSAQFRMDSFVSYIPTVVDIQFDDITLDIGGMVDLGLRFGNYMVSASDDTEDLEASEAQAFVDALEMAQTKLPEFGFDRMTIDFAMKADWAADAGDFSFDYKSQAEDFAGESMQVGLVFPTYGDIVSTFAGDEPSGDFEQVFEDSFAFTGFRYAMSDFGGFDRMFGFAQSIGAEYQEEGWGAMLANMDPAQMRTTMATFVRLAKGEARTEFPPAVEWIESVAAFLETSGGEIEFLVQPSEPITSETFDAPQFEDEDVDWIVARLGISVTHSPE